MDENTKKIHKFLLSSKEPLETKEVEKEFPKLSRGKIMTRLLLLATQGKIKCKKCGSGKGIWIWHTPKK